MKRLTYFFARCLLLAGALLLTPQAQAKAQPERVKDPALAHPAHGGKKQKLPVKNIPITGDQSEYFAVVMTGDGGWSRFTQAMCNTLAAHGIPVWGLNSLKYLHKAKTPEQLSADLARMIRMGEAATGKDKIILIGYSCGANLVPFAYNRLDDSLKAKVQFLALLSPDGMADFKFHLYNWVEHNSPAALSVKPEIEQLRGKPVLFIYGERENYSWCGDLIREQFNLKTIPGGHRFYRQKAGVTDELLHFQN